MPARQAAVAFLAMVPLAISICAAYAAWETTVGILTVWRMITITLVWIGAFALGTQLFWKVTGLLATKPQ